MVLITKRTVMIVCNKFVFLHLHKSGGTFVNQMMAKCIPYARQIGYHLPYKELPASFRRQPVLGTVRNPWSYYVSWYHFQAAQERPNDLFQCMSENNTLNFDDTVSNLLCLHSSPQKIQELAALMPETYVNHGLNLTRDCILSIAGSGQGFFSFLYKRLYAGADKLTVLKMENLRDGLRTFLDRHDVEPRSRLHEFINNTPRLNTSDHSGYTSYYSSALRSLVAESESALIEEHGYLFGCEGGSYL